MKQKFIAFLSFWPLIYFPIHVVVQTETVINSCGLPYSLWLAYKITLVVGVISSYILFGMMVYFLVLIHKHKIIPEDKRLNWTIALFLFNIFSVPIFWFKYARHHIDATQQAPA